MGGQHRDAPVALATPGQHDPGGGQDRRRRYEGYPRPGRGRQACANSSRCPRARCEPANDCRELLERFADCLRPEVLAQRRTFSEVGEWTPLIDNLCASLVKDRILFGMAERYAPISRSEGNVTGE